MSDPPPPYQPGYPPQQPGYPPQQPGYPPQQPGYQPQLPGYQPQQPGYPPQQPGYPPAGSQYAPTSTSTTTTVIATQPAAVTMSVVFNEFPVAMTCPSCRAQIVTAVMHEPGTMAYLLFFLMCIFGFWICCCIPFCVDSCKDAVHSCPNCRAQVGVFRRM